MDTPRRDSNRIEVDLKVLQDKELTKLRLFATQFHGSVTTLAGTLDRYTDQVAAHAQGLAGGAGGGQRMGPRGMVGNPLSTAHVLMSTPDQIAAQRQKFNDNREATRHLEGVADQERAQRMETRQMMAEGAAVAAGASRGPGAPGGSGSSSGPGVTTERKSRGGPSGGFTGLGDEGFADDIFVSQLFSNPGKAIFSATGGLTLASQLANRVTAQNASTQRPTQFTVAGRQMNVNQYVGSAVEKVGGQAGWAIPAATGAAYLSSSWGNRSVTGQLSMAQQLGMDVGVDGAYGFQSMPLLNLTTDGGRQAFKAKWSDKLSTLSPVWSGEQAAERRQMLTEMGLKDDPTGILKHAAQRGGSMGASAQQFDVRRRYDMSSLGTLETEFDALAKAAGAAGMSVEKFQAAMVEAAGQVSQATGLRQADAEKYVTSAASMGMTPEQAAAFGNRDLSLRTLANQRSNGNGAMTYADVYRNPTLNIKQAQREAAAIMPALADPERMRYLRKNKNKSEALNREYAALESQFMLIGSDPSVQQNILQGMTPEQFLATYDDDRMAATDAQARVQEALNIGSVGNISRRDMRKMMKQSGLDKDKISDVMDTDAGDGHGKYHNQLVAMQQAISESSGLKDKGSTSKLELTSDAKRLVKLLDTTSDVAKSASNFIPGGPGVNFAIQVGKALS